MNRCKTCRWWTIGKRYGREVRECSHPKLHEDYGVEPDADALVYSYYEGGAFYPGPEFGCVHHEPVVA
jgi:hypothetical protein